jgi:hypothetical protein
MNLSHSPPYSCLIGPLRLEDKIKIPVSYFELDLDQESGL